MQYFKNSLSPEALIAWTFRIIENVYEKLYGLIVFIRGSIVETKASKNNHLQF